jgi:hypothetical protein
LGAKCRSCGEQVECIDVVQEMNFNRGNTVKYVWRAGAKNKTKVVEDLKKAREYLDFEIARLESVEKPVRAKAPRRTVKP